MRDGRLVWYELGSFLKLGKGFFFFLFSCCITFNTEVVFYNQFIICLKKNPHNNKNVPLFWREVCVGSGKEGAQGEAGRREEWGNCGDKIKEVLFLKSEIKLL